jgi:hypothetical protein
MMTRTRSSWMMKQQQYVISDDLDDDVTERYKYFYADF